MLKSSPKVLKLKLNKVSPTKKNLSYKFEYELVVNDFVFPYLFYINKKILKFSLQEVSHILLSQKMFSYPRIDRLTRLDKSDVIFTNTPIISGVTSSF